MVGLLLSALGVSAILLPASLGGGQRPAAADRPPTGVGAFGAAPAPTARAAAKPRPRPSPASPTPTRSPRRTATSGAGVPTRPVATGQTAQEDQVTLLVDKERAKAGCGAVRTDERLRTAAREHSQDMATNDYFSHIAPDGSTFVDRAAAAGYPRDQAGGENIAMGYGTPADVMAGWMNSEGHRANILNCDFRAIGVGLARNSGGTPYWTQVFGRS